MKKLLVVLGVAGAMLAAEAAMLAGGATNYWQGPSGSSWGDDDNWSLGHKPTETETVDFTNNTALTVQVTGDHTCFCFYVYTANTKAPITFTGGGSITASGTSGHYSKKPLILDGVSLTLDGRETLFYANVTLRNGGRMLSSDKQNFYLWGGKAEFAVEDGEISCGPLGYASTPSAVTLTKGKVSCTAVKEVSRDHSGRCNLTVNGGEFFCTGAFTLTNSTTLAVNGGSLTIGGTVTLMDTVTLALNGGAITNACAITLAQKRLITESRGTALATTASDIAVDIFDQDGETLTFAAPFSAPNGYFSTTNNVTIASEHPFAVRRFYYPPTSQLSRILTLKLPLIVVSDLFPFDTANGNSRDFYVDGPLTIRPSVAEMTKSSNKTAYVRIDGDMTVDTRDIADPSLLRAMAFRNVGSRNGNGAIIVRGGGSFYMVQMGSETFRKIIVEDGTTLEVGPFVNAEYGPLNAERFVLGPNAVLKIKAGSNTVHAASVEIDPTARIEVEVPAGFAYGGASILRDQSGALGDISSQVTLSGVGATGCSVVVAGGVVSVVKPVSDVDGAYAQEWTGAAGNGKWSEAQNWYNNAAPVKDSKTTTYVFGCKDSIRETDYDVSGSYLAAVYYRATAVKSFTLLKSSNERTFFHDGTSFSITESASPSVYSQSSVPQYFGFKFRRTGVGKRFSFAAQDAPIVVTSPYCYFPNGGLLTILGDVRISGTISYPNVQLYRVSSSTVPRTLLTILNGGSLVVTNQTAVLGGAYSAFAVHKGGSLVFRGLTDDAVYKWDQKPSKQIIDGSMEIQAPFCGGFDQVYGGEGNLTLARTRPMTAASSLTLSDTLAARMTADWTTTAADADYPLTIKTASFSNPKIVLSSDWTYGPASGAVPESIASDRALVVDRESVLTVDAGGFAATFADPVDGDGKLVVTNGTVRLAAAGPNLALRLADLGVLELSGDLSLGTIEPAGGTISFASEGVVALSGSISVEGLRIGFSDVKPDDWRTLMTASSISGTPVVSGAYKTRIVSTADGMALQCRRRLGSALFLR